MSTRERMVEVEWLDSTSWSEWRSRSDYEGKAKAEELRHRSCGYVVADNEDGLMLALNITAYPDDEAGDGLASDVVMIPRAVVVAVHDLRRKGGR
jgi:hypothetical protein